jgi:hypothetical protein
MEARALAKFTPPDGILQDLGKDINIRIPQLLLYDEEEHILVIEDLGSHISLNSLIAQLSPETSLSDLDEMPIHLKSAGHRVGTFLAQLHSKATVRKILQTSSRDSLVNSFGFDVVFDNCIKPIQAKLQKYTPDERKDASWKNSIEAWNKHILENFCRPNAPDEESFVMGDCYPGSILLPIDISPDNPVSVIDWEFSGIGRGHHGDMAQFLAHLTIAIMFAKHNSQRAIAVGAFADGFCEAYRNHSSDWFGAIIPRELKDPENRMRLEVLRSALNLYGGEIINAGCDDDFSPLKVDPVGAAAAGSWYVDKAGSSIDDMVETHWNDIASKKNNMLLSLFTIAK